MQEDCNQWAELKDTLRAKKDVLGLSYQELSELSGLPVHTITNYFSGRSKEGMVSTAGYLCKALHVSFDKAFGIDAEDADDPKSVQRIHELEIENVRQGEEIDHLIAMQKVQTAQTATKNMTHLVLVGLCLMLTVALAAYIFFDAGDHSHGYIINGRLTLVAVIMIGVLAVSIGVIVWAMLRYLFRR